MRREREPGDNSRMHTPEDSLLGREVAYPQHYDPSLLFPIPRAQGRTEAREHAGTCDHLHVGSASRIRPLCDLRRIHAAIGVRAFIPQVGGDVAAGDDVDALRLEHDDARAFVRRRNGATGEHVGERIRLAPAGTDETGGRARNAIVVRVGRRVRDLRAVADREDIRIAP